MSLMRIQKLKPFLEKSRDYSLGVLSNLAKKLSLLKQIALESPTQKELNGACLSLIACSGAEIAMEK